MARVAVTSWFGAFVLEEGAIVARYPASLDPGSLRARIALRRSGALTPEEEELLSQENVPALLTRDRRLADRGARFEPGRTERLPPTEGAPEVSIFREALLEEDEAALAAQWDPSIHVEEAVRAVAEIDRVRNMLGERISSWSSRDAPEVEAEDHEAAVRRLLGGEAAQGAALAIDPDLARGRRELGEIYRTLGATRATLEGAIAASVPRTCPNLSALLGPALAGRMLAQAGGLGRMSRLPASTLQVLGAERAFFEHLRGRAPPPRHGLLFLHPRVQSAPRSERGRLARALAGATAIAARLDRAGAPLDPDLARGFETRATHIRATPRRRKGPARRSGPPLDRTARHR